jgi:hypothetical protein
LSPRRQYAAFLGLVAAALVAAFALGRRRVRGDVLAAVPRDAWLLATVEVEALRTSPLAQAFAGAGGVTIPGLGRLSDACGFEPLARLTQVALVAPETEGDFGVAFAGDFGKGELSRCAEKVLRARGGQPSTEVRGSFTVVVDASEPKRARLAYRDGGPFLVGRGPWLSTMIDAVDGKADRARPELLALRASLSKAPPLARAIVVTALLPRAMRDRLRAEIESGAGAPGEAYAAVLSVDRAGLAVATGAAGSTTYLGAEVHCESPEACGEVKRLVEQRRSAASASPALRLLGLGPAIDSLSVEAHGPTLTATAQAPTDDLSRLATRLSTFSR